MPESELKVFKRGKVRDVYDLGNERLLIVASDRVSTHDVVHETPIPDKGKILTQMSNFWFEKMRKIVPNHLIETDFEKFPEEIRKNFPEFRGRSVIVHKAEVLPVECIVRGYLAGSAWREYRQTGKISGITLPKGLRENEELPEPIFTPSTKAETGHDENIDFNQLIKIVGEKHAKELREKSLEIYEEARKHAKTNGILLADTKFEFGMHEGRIMLVDEALTPDSSRFWEASTHAAGKEPESFDKEPLRKHAVDQGWDKKPPGLVLPKKVVEATQKRYKDAFQRLTGKKFENS